MKTEGRRGEYFLPKLLSEEAGDIAYQQLLHTVMRQGSGESKPMTMKILDSSLLYWPFWVLYLQRKQYMDICLLDAVTAQPGGNRSKAGMLGAFTHAHAATEDLGDMV